MITLTTRAVALGRYVNSSSIAELIVAYVYVVVFMLGGNIPHNLAGLVNGQLIQGKRYTLVAPRTLTIHTPKYMVYNQEVEAMCNKRLGIRLLFIQV